MNDTPPMLDVLPDGIPGDLMDCDQWVAWRLEHKNGKPTKLPYNVATGRLASSTDPKTWSTFEDALEAYRRPDSGYAGIGFVFTPDDPFVGVDLDHCVNEHGLSTWLGAQLKAWPDDPPEPWEIVKALGSYAELSPSGMGVKVFCKGKLSEGRRKSGDFELYDEKRYFTVTGHRLDGAPTAVLNGGALSGIYRAFFAATAKPAAKQRATGVAVTADDGEIIRRIIASRSGSKFLRLWAGNTDGYPSESEADLALAGMLRFWVQDAGQIERLMRASGLVREKWDKHRDYLGRTVAHVIDAGGEAFNWGRETPASDTESTILKIDINNDQAVEAELITLLGRNAMEDSPRNSEEIKAEFADAVRQVKEARRKKRGVGREVTLDEDGKPVGWNLIVVQTDPPTYKLESPFWEGQVVGLTVDDLQTRGRIQKRAMEQRGALWVPPYFAKTWFGHESREGYVKGVAELLMPHATGEQASDDVKRPAIVLDRVSEAIAGIVGHRGLRDTDEKITPERLPCRDHAGNVWFTFTEVYDAVALSADRPTRGEVHAALTRLGVDDAAVGRGNERRRCKMLPRGATPNLPVTQHGEL